MEQDSSMPVVSSGLAEDGGAVDGNDADFEITAEMMVHEIDDERTLDEEDEDEDFADEINELEKEGEMPLEDLLLMYGYDNAEEAPVQSASPGSSEVTLSSVTGDPHLSRAGKENDMVPSTAVAKPVEDDATSTISSNSAESAERSSINQEENDDPFHNQRITRGLAALNSQYFDDSSSDDEYQPYSEDWKKEVQIGPNYQAEVPESTSVGGQDEVETAEDKLLWKPGIVDGKKLQSALQAIMQSAGQEIGNCERDDEQALYTLLQNNGDIDAALCRTKDQSHALPEVSLWSEEECKQFEQGLKIYGKNFRIIQSNKVPSRSVGEIVQFYYLWKKTERHDLFVMQSRLGKRKYGLPGVADYMDRFMDENESIVSSRAASPILPGDHQPASSNDLQDRLVNPPPERVMGNETRIVGISQSVATSVDGVSDVKRQRLEVVVPTQAERPPPPPLATAPCTTKDHHVMHERIAPFKHLNIATSVGNTSLPVASTF